MADWYVYQHDGDYLGPWPTETVADQIVRGKLGSDVWVAPPGGQRWLRAMDVPVIARLIEGVPTRPKRRDSGLRLMSHAVQQALAAKTLDDIDSAAETLKMPAMSGDVAPPTERDPDMPPVSSFASFAPAMPSPTPTPTTPTLESTGNNRRRRKNG